MTLKRLFAAGLGAAAVLTMTGCLMAPVVPPTGMVYTNFSAPLDYDQEQSPAGTKEGSASTHSILGLVAWGDSSADAAAKQGGISTITGADYDYMNIIGIYQRYTTVVRGE
ncbi:hypothetical protein HZA57_06920 [Candidatus Poribacteria bacterium]|nr:hypothetical protein [Candidatus Poribacteria bacterium]